MNKKNFLIPILLTVTVCFSCGGNKSSESGSSIASESTSEITSIDVDHAIVNFDTHGSYDIAPMEYDGTPLKLPQPTYYHHTFEGWFESSSYSGNRVNEEAYVPNNYEITLHAKWDDVLYLYLYIGGPISSEYVRYEYHSGDSFNLTDLETPDPITYKGAICEFVGWEEEYTYAKAKASYTFEDEDILLVAKFNTSKLPPEKYLKDLGDDSYEATGNVIWPFEDKKTHDCYFSIDVSQTKGSSGGAGVAFRMIHSGANYAYEKDGSSYIACVMTFNTGYIQLSEVCDGTWKEIKSYSLSTLPSAFQAKFNNCEMYQYFDFNIAVLSSESQFSILLDGDVAVTLTAQDINTLIGSKPALSPLSRFNGTGYGIRSSSTGAIFKNPKIRTESITINLDAGEGGALDPVEYYGGKLALPNPRYENHSIDYWCYDEALTQKVDLANPQVSDGDTLHAKYKLVQHPYLIDNKDGTYKMTNQGAALIGVASSLNYVVEGEFSIKKGSGGASGIIIRGSMFADNTFQNDAKYLMVQFAAGNGSIQIATNDYTRDPVFRHLGGSTAGRALSNTPVSWQNAFNLASTGELVTGKLKVVSTTNSLSVYINDELFFEPTTQAMIDDVNCVKGLGYGIRINNADNLNLNFKYTFTQN